ncbi:hypothetical protein H634G_03560 [Metarhizium anisopliae BRIP 53293]|uniref:Life-span regulatory factor domain-containing protein n=1 Tax=Metarhizium anisopliae BRIP 53293 TaxID=1291518 RepID=A0A0D9P450_METAN|nr:hypothetical protein H634G_03560 [Metarhizium anisopliae BRIP 53293]KJK86743.1 hypothetical protein H633G_09399 [Metarhizium anisopliae BRIP 53284]
MAFNLWAHQFCLACDKQVQVDGAAYCSESCRLADQEKTSTPSSQASSPAFAPAGYPWSTPSSSLCHRSSSSLSPSRPKFYLSPAYDFGNPQAYGASSAARSLSLSSDHTASTFEQSTSTYAANLTPSSSHSSLCSMRSTSTTGEPNQLSDNAKQELKAYAISFEHVRLQRRRSY